VGLVGLTLACAPPERQAESPAAVDSAPQAGGTLIRRLEVDIVTLNPILAATRYDRQVAKHLFTPLVNLDRDLEPAPGLATSWEVSEDGRLYRFELDPKATFADGRPVRPEDVLFTLRKIVDPESEAVQVQASFAGLDLSRTRISGDHTIEIAFRFPLASRLIRFTDLLVLPEHVYGGGDFRNDYNDIAVGSGPYILEKFERGKEVIVRKRQGYWSTNPHIDRVHFKVIGSLQTAWNALQRGDIDETTLSSDTWLREKDNPELKKRINFLHFYALNYNFIAWNTRHRLLREPRIRRALAMCVPIESVVRDLYHGAARAMSGPFTPDEFAFNPSVPVMRHDVSEARRELASAGWLDQDGDGVLEKDGRPFELELLLMSGSGTTQEFAQMYQAELAKAGVRLNLNVIDGAMAIQRILEGNYESAYMSWDLDPDPDLYPILHSSQFPPTGQNFVYYSNPAADRLMEQARVELDPGKRREIFWKLHELLASEQPYTWTVQPALRWGVNQRVRGVEVSRGYGLFLWYPGEFAWWIPRELRRAER
jgi:peptide/nickel transport system substrate-binding protein